LAHQVMGAARLTICSSCSQNHMCSLYQAIQLNADFCHDVNPGNGYPSTSYFNDAFTAGNATATRPTLGRALKTYNVYVIFYGNNWHVNQMNYIQTFIKNLGGSAWYQSMFGNTSPTTNLLNLKDTKRINATASTSITGTTYYDSEGHAHDDPFIEGSSILDMMFSNATWTNQVSASQIFTNYAYMKNNPIYIFLQSDEARYMRGYWYDWYCGTHFQHYCNTTITSDTRGCDYFYNMGKTVGQTTFPFIFAYLWGSGTDPNNNYYCNPYYSGSTMNVPGVSVSGDVGLDALINTLAHEIVETVSGFQIANMCVYDYKNGNAGMSSVTVGGQPYLLQKNYNTQTGTCN